MRSPSLERYTQIFLSLQTTTITFLLYSMSLEELSNAFFRTWLSQNFSLGLILLSEWAVAAAIAGLLLVTGYWIFQLERYNRATDGLGQGQRPQFESKTEKRPTLETRGSSRRIIEIFLPLQTVIIALQLVWAFLDEGSNAFLRAWFSQNFSLGLVLLNGPLLAIAIAALSIVTGYWILRWEAEWKGRTLRMVLSEKVGVDIENRLRPSPLPTPSHATIRPFYETVELMPFAVLLVLFTQAVSLWFVTASIFRVTSFTANSFYYYSHLPFTYWWGLAAALLLFFAGANLKGRARIALELCTLFLLAFYLVGLSSFTYQDPRFLDAYYHTGNSLDLINFQDWLTSPNWYVHQFPGAFVFIGQLTSMAGIDSFQLMRFYPVALTLVIVFQAYVIARMFSHQYAPLASGVLLGGLWFQLHISPQSLELVLYLGIVFLFLKTIDDEPRRKLWTILGLVAAPIFVASHPETPLAVGGGIVGFLFLAFLKSKQTFSQQLSKIVLPFLALAGIVVFWWAFIAVDARILVQTSIVDRALRRVFGAALGPTSSTANVAATPSYSYGITVLLEQGVSVLVWGVGLSYFLLIRKLHLRELFLGGFFLTAVSTIAIAVFAREDVLQRSYLFALIPFTVLTASLLERRSVLTLRQWNFFRLLRVGFMIMLVLFAAIIPLTRYGVDPIEYLPASSLHVSNIAASLYQQHSVLFLHPDEDGWRYFAGLRGAIREPSAEQANLTNREGGYVRAGADPTVPGFNLTYTQADDSANYIVLTSYWQNLYTLRFGSNSGFYIQARNNYTIVVKQNFNIVYSTGTDQICANPNLG
jgi:hypothetical protein